MRETSFVLDVSTLVVVATCVTAFLGLFLLTAWTQDRSRAMLWWGSAYLVGGFSVALWLLDLPAELAGLPNALIFFACGMMWNAARIFQGRRVLWPGLCAGAVVWVLASAWPDFATATSVRIALSSLIIASYTFLTAAELWRERRKSVLPSRWLAIVVPLLHGIVFLLPLPLAGLLPQESGMMSLSTRWVGLFAIETLLYVVGTAFIVLVLSKERMVRIHKTAASTDPLTGLFNRRAFFEAAGEMMARRAKRGEPVSVLAFDLDHFKSINDRFGHALGDEALRVFAATAAANMRADDVIGRLGGEEFIALIPGDVAAATAAAERVRLAFEEVGRIIGGQAVGATVSIGAASGPATMDVHALMGWGDYALYAAKANGRNRVETTVADVLDVAPLPVKPAAAAAAAEASVLPPAVVAQPA